MVDSRVLINAWWAEQTGDMRLRLTRDTVGYLFKTLAHGRWCRVCAVVACMIRVHICTVVAPL